MLDLGLGSSVQGDMDVILDRIKQMAREISKGLEHLTYCDRCESLEEKAQEGISLMYKNI